MFIKKSILRHHNDYFIVDVLKIFYLIKANIRSNKVGIVSRYIEVIYFAQKCHSHNNPLMIS